MNSDSQPLPRAWLVVALLWFVVLSNYLARLLPTTMHGSLVAAIPMTEAQFGLLTSALFWTYGLMSPFCGFLADRFSRSRVIIASMLVWSTVTWLTSYTRTFEQLLVLRILMGVGEACYLPTAFALISDYHRGSTRSLAIGIHNTGDAVGVGLSGLGGWLADERSWHFAFGLVGLVGIGYSVLLAFRLRDAPRERPAGTSGGGLKSKARFTEALASLFSRGSFVMVLVCGALFGMTVWTVFAWVPVFIQEHFHLTQGAAGLSGTGYMQAAAVPGLLIGGAWADRWNRFDGRAYMYVAAIGLFVASLGLLLTSNTGLIVLAVAGLMIFRMFLAFAGGNFMSVLCEVVDPRYRATGYGLINLMASIGAGLGIYFSGVIRDAKIDLHVAFDIIAVVTMVCALGFYLIKPDKARLPQMA